MMSLSTRRSISIVSGQLWDVWDRMTVAELTLFVGLFGKDVVPSNLHRRAERLAAVRVAARDNAGPDTGSGRRPRQRDTLDGMTKQRQTTLTTGERDEQQ
jgi:hypothetical protein